MTDTKTWECPRCGQICHTPSNESPQLCLNCVLTAGEPAPRQPETVLETPPVHEISSGEDRGTPNNRSRHRPIRRPFFGPGHTYGMLVGAIAGFLFGLVMIPSATDYIPPILTIILGTLLGVGVGYIKGPQMARDNHYLTSVSKNPLPYCLKSLKSEDAALRESAAKWLGKLGSAAEEAIPALKAVVEGDRESKVRVAAERALIDIRNSLRNAQIDQDTT